LADDDDLLFLGELVGSGARLLGLRGGGAFLGRRGRSLRLGMDRERKKGGAKQQQRET
jgi:hypothetical protein